MTAEACGICDLLAADTDVIAATPHFVVTTGMGVPGWCMVSARRHEAAGLWALSDDESAALGPLLSRVAAALKATVSAERVYLLSFGEHALHFHVLLQARPPQTPADHRGPAMFGKAAELRDEAAARDLAARLRDLLAEPGSASTP
jgi:diadenosine tetraphosphate (Ap4A) HIT family hydrolase